MVLWNVSVRLRKTSWRGSANETRREARAVWQCGHVYVGWTLGLGGAERGRVCLAQRLARLISQTWLTWGRWVRGGWWVNLTCSCLSRRNGNEDHSGQARCSFVQIRANLLVLGERWHSHTQIICFSFWLIRLMEPPAGKDGERVGQEEKRS